MTNRKDVWVTQPERVEILELDALRPDELRRRIEQAIRSHIDEAAWQRALQAEEAEPSRWRPT